MLSRRCGQPYDPKLSKDHDLCIYFAAYSPAFTGNA